MNDNPNKEHLEALIASAAAFNVSHLVCHTPHGIFMVDPRDSEIGRSLLLKGEFEYAEKRRWFEYIAPNPQGMLIDIGANIGTTSVPLLLDNLVGSVISFEPDPNNFSMLQYNFTANGLSSRATALNCALSSSAGTLKFELSASNFGDHRIHYRDFPGGNYGEASRNIINVPTFTLDQIIEQGSIDLSKCIAIKSDTQGSEGHILKGASTTLKAKLPWIIEFWPYGIQRTGFLKNDFIDIVTANFSSFIEFKPDNSIVKSPIKEFYRLFVTYVSTQFCNLILLP
jgi:FkbM family methyltransferase